MLIHGDAAFAGQGVVAETLNLSQLRGYRTGGTVHVVVNNQVGFTTAPQYSRSSVYATDVARMIQAPIFHVNGDDPEAVVRMARLAFEYRQAFKKDVVVDMVCYRKRGHNEADNPSFTQPLMYDLIDAKRSVRKLYTESLIGRGDITMEEAEARAARLPAAAGAGLHRDQGRGGPAAEPGSVLRPEPEDRPVNHEAVPTAVTAETVKRIIDTQVNLPADFTPHPRLKPLLDRRAAMREEDAIDWAIGELLAFGSLVLDGHPVRLVGQDTRRGTFGQRHAVLVDRHTGAEYTPLQAARVAARPSSSCTTRCCPSSPRWASSTATRWPARTRWSAGRPSSATSSTARRRSSTSSSAPASRSGASAPASCCCCRTATRARGPTTPRPGSSGSCSCAPRTT